MQVNNTVLAHVESSQDSCWHSCEDTMSAHAHLPAEAYGLWCQSRLSGESLTALTLDLPRCCSTAGMALNCANSSHESSGTQVPARSDKDVQTAQSYRDERDVMAVSSCMAQMSGLQKLCGSASERSCASDREDRAAAAAASASGEAAAATGNLSGGCHSSGTDCPAEHEERAVSVLSDGQNIKKDCESLEGKCTQRNDSAGRDAGTGVGTGSGTGAGAGSGSCAGAGDGRVYGICEADLDAIIALWESQGGDADVGQSTLLVATYGNDSCSNSQSAAADIVLRGGGGRRAYSDLMASERRADRILSARCVHRNLRDILARAGMTSLY
ncbi:MULTISPECIES: hypothetical protein [unclassified Anaerobiospirillum]|uniref:hypothetical protein n=1 Tax=unclassified Anaerobiospirillum TaxID=2647410 RepID=UPI001FF309D2|nr:MULTISPECIES: hypothetical protein [unclassified Anaerobiospirillum]MCK0533701.1 hypothetical protein [Anaerobiospirillum sp. NML120511]MCK0540055.1 hypothetical protein [Anaerobiospirillum sp. NML02-A-032]